MMGLVVSSTIDFDDHLPGFRAPILSYLLSRTAGEKRGDKEGGHQIN